MKGENRFVTADKNNPKVVGSPNLLHEFRSFFPGNIKLLNFRRQSLLLQTGKWHFFLSGRLPYWDTLFSENKFTVFRGENL